MALINNMKRTITCSSRKSVLMYWKLARVFVLEASQSLPGWEDLDYFQAHSKESGHLDGADLRRLGQLKRSCSRGLRTASAGCLWYGWLQLKSFGSKWPCIKQKKLHLTSLSSLYSNQHIQFHIRNIYIFFKILIKTQIDNWGFIFKLIP